MTLNKQKHITAEDGVNAHCKWDAVPNLNLPGSRPNINRKKHLPKSTYQKQHIGNSNGPMFGKCSNSNQNPKQYETFRISTHSANGP